MIEVIDMVSNANRAFPWTKYYTLFKMPAIYDVQMEDGGVPSEQVDLLPFEDDPFTHVWLSMHGEKALGYIVLQQKARLWYEGHVGFRPGVSGQVKLRSIHYVFERIARSGGKKISALIPTYNRAARMLVCAAGMRREGVVTASFLRDGVMQDQIQYGVNF